MVNETRSVRDHEDVWDVLPWYVNGTLAQAERATVEAHLGVCRECRTELERCRGLSRALHAEEAPDWVPSAAHFAGIVGRLDALAATAQRPAAMPAGTRKGMATLLGWFDGTPGPVRWAMAVQAVVVVVLAAALLERPAPYGTLTSPAETPATAGPRVQMVPASDMSEGELRKLLHAAGATIVHGPSAAGVYTLSLSGPTVEEALAVLRQHPKVRLAEPKSP